MKKVKTYNAKFRFLDQKESERLKALTKRRGYDGFVEKWIELGIPGNVPSYWSWNYVLSGRSRNLRILEVVKKMAEEEQELLKSIKNGQ